MTHIFIVNPYAGQKNFSSELRLRLAEIKDFEYFIFNTRCAGDEQDLVRRIQNIFRGEKLRFYCCGGSGTMRNMLNGFDDLDNVEIAFYPCGLTNDFLKVFGEEEKRFHEIDQLIDGELIDIDYIKTNHGVALNTCTVGLDPYYLDGLKQYRITTAFGKQVPYFFSILSTIFASRPSEYEICLDDESVTGNFAEIYFGNGHVFGGNLHMSEPSPVDDGKGTYMLFGNYKGISILSPIQHAMRKEYSKLKKCADTGFCTTMKICKTNHLSFHLNLDGELIQHIAECEVTIVQKGLHFVVPKGVRI